MYTSYSIHIIRKSRTRNIFIPCPTLILPIATNALTVN